MTDVSHRIGICFLAVGIAASIHACSDPKAASKTTFQKVIESSFESASARCLGSKEHPVDKILDTELWSYDQKKFWIPSQTPFEGKPESALFLGYLASANLVKKNELGKMERLVKQDSFFGKQKSESVYVIRYELTDQGRQYVKESRLCLGKKRLVEVLEWTEPAADAMGVIVTTVKIKQTFDLPESVQKTAPEQQKSFLGHIHGQPEEQAIKLVRMNDGWKIPQ